MKNGIVLANKRTGSTFLQEALNSHPNIRCYDEMFMIKTRLKQRRGGVLYKTKKEESGMGKKEYINGLFSQFDGSSLFRLMYPHCNHGNLTDIVLKMNLPIIHLIRTNHFNQFVSFKTKKENKVKINESEMISTINKVREEIEGFRKKFSKANNYIEVYYEDMIGKVEGEKENVEKRGAFNITSDQVSYLSNKYSKQICDILGVEYQDLYCNISKRNSPNVGEHITNAKQVKQILKNNGMGEFV